MRLVRKLERQITLEELKGHKEGALSGMALFNRPRLSVQPVGKQHWDFILGLEGQPPPPSSSGKAGKAGKAAKAAPGEQGGEAAAQREAAAGGRKGSSAGSKATAKRRKASAASAVEGEEGG